MFRRYGFREDIYNLYIDVNQPCDFHKLASSPIAASVSWNGKFLTAKLLRESVIDILLDSEFYKRLDDTSDVMSVMEVLLLEPLPLVTITQ